LGETNVTVPQPDETVSSQRREKERLRLVSPPKHEMCVAKISCININRMTTLARVKMLTEFIRRHYLDMLFVKGVQITGYITHLNIGTAMQ
jgi:hypothetical protein